MVDSELILDDKNKGFTLIEVMVAIFIGLVVMAMAVAIVGVTNSTSLRVLAKSDAQQTTRGALVKVLDNLANAESLDICRVGINKTAQDEIALNPKRPSIALDDCKETAASGYVLGYAQPNRLCYFNKGDTGNPAKLLCITKGGAAPTPKPGSTYSNPSTGMNISSCAGYSFPAGTENLIYLYTCDPNAGSSQIKWPTIYAAPVLSSQTVIADLKSSAGSSPVNDLFSYTLDSSASSNYVQDAQMDKVVSVKLDLSIKYKSNRNTSNEDTYKFAQEVVLRGSKFAQEEKYNG
ncbi:MAG: prepilin-type N-terminal cleavage/methylation domain-containing protein [Acidimicrobiia bacterium]